MRSETTKLSPQVIEAQARLMQLRTQLGVISRSQVDAPWDAEDAAPAVNWSLSNAQTALQDKRLQLVRNSGYRWGTAPQPASREPWQEEGLATTEAPDNQEAIVVVHPTLLLSMLKENLEASGRVWLLLRAIDRQGRGWLHVEDIRRKLTAKDSNWRICGWRRLRQLLHQGQDIFWERDKNGRLWLKGAHRIAYTLNSGRLQGFPVELPLARFWAEFRPLGRHFTPVFMVGGIRNQSAGKP